jgi:hypothetical protein
MRHFLSSPSAIATLACGMGKTAPACSLVTSTCLSTRLPAGALGAPLTAVDIAPVAVAADHHLAATTDTVEQTGVALHRPLLPMRAGLEPARERYFALGRASHGAGARHRADCGGQDRCRACLNGPLDLTDSASPVTSFRPHRRPPKPPRLPPLRRQVFTTLVGDSPRDSPTKRVSAEPPTHYTGLTRGMFFLPTKEALLGVAAGARDQGRHP